MKHLYSATFVCGALLACSNEQPNTQPTPPLVIEAGVTPASPPRTVGHRNPFGDVLQPDNLMADGDFELTGRSDQAPWLLVDNNGQTTLNYDTGGHCRSGVRCAVMAYGQYLVGYLASPPQSDFVVRAYIKPDTSNCNDARVLTIDQAQQGTTSTIPVASQSPDVDGWCLFEGKATNLAFLQPMIYIEILSNKSKQITVDQVSVLPVGESPVHPAMIPQSPPSPETLAHIAFVRDWIRTHRKFGRPSSKSLVP